MVKCCVFFAVRTEFLNIIWTSIGFKGLMINIRTVNTFSYLGCNLSNEELLVWFSSSLKDNKRQVLKFITLYSTSFKNYITKR
jgi:hypothetical protein